MINIEKLLRESKDVSDYRINTTVTESYELFFVHKKLETVRGTNTSSVNVTVYVDHEGKKGDASFKLFASTDENGAREKIAAAVAKARIVDNENYELPSNETLDGKIESNFESYEPKELGARIAEAVYAADNFELGSINALEVFVNKLTVSVKNSRGIDKKEVKYSAMLEAIPTWNDGESVELYEAKNFNSLDTDDITAEIARKMEEVRDRGYAKKPDKKLECPVVLGAFELKELLHELVYGLNFSAVYSHSNPFSEGDALQKAPKHDKLSVTMKGSLVGSVDSALFDAAGTTLTDREVIKDGVVASYFGSSRFAQYLGKEPTGSLSCIEVAAGTLSDGELEKAPYFECVSMSGLQADVFNDYIGGEVRLAYYFDGEKKIPVTGISISGKLSDALNTLRLSDTVINTDGYRGPKLALLENIEIV